MAFDYFSSLCLYDALIYQCYNLFYTSMPIVIYAIFDEEYDQNDAEKL
jgi:phospholipid-transporting ATPase